MTTPDDFNEFLHFDPLHTVESLMGDADEQDVQDVSLAVALAYNEAKREELGLRDDTYYGMAYDDYVRIVEDMGFVCAYEEHFLGTDNCEETYRVYWRRGLLLRCESYRAATLNSASMYLNAEFATSDAAWAIPMSGHLNGQAHDERRYVWVGDMNAVEALRHRVQHLEANSTIFESWVEQPYLYLVNYAESHDDYTFTTDVKIDQMPAEVRAAIRP